MLPLLVLAVRFAQRDHNPIRRTAGRQASPLEHQFESVIYVEYAFDFRRDYTAKPFAWRNDLNTRLACKLGQRLSSLFCRNVESYDLRDRGRTKECGSYCTAKRSPNNSAFQIFPPNPALRRLTLVLSWFSTRRRSFLNFPYVFFSASAEILTSPSSTCKCNPRAAAASLAKPMGSLAANKPVIVRLPAAGSTTIRTSLYRANSSAASLRVSLSNAICPYCHARSRLTFSCGKLAAMIRSLRDDNARILALTRTGNTRATASARLSSTTPSLTST